METVRIPTHAFRPGGAHSKTAGHVYLVRMHDMGGAIKIGFAAHPDKRLTGMQPCTPYKLDLIWWAPGDREDEYRLHRDFAQAQIRGEWFRPVPELLALARSKSLPEWWGKPWLRRETA